MKNFRKPDPALALLICLLIWTTVRQLAGAQSWGHDSYQLTEWLINYSGGFVRRGLPGEILLHLSAMTGLQANHLALAFSTVCFLVLTAWFLRHARDFFPPILLLSCVLMGFPAYQDSILRKDCMCLLLLLLCLKLDDLQLPGIAKTALVNSAAITALLSHEAFAFYGLAALMVYGSPSRPGHGLKACAGRCLILLPAFACFFLTTVFHGTPEIARTVNDSWLQLWHAIEPGNPAIHQPAASILALGWTTTEGMHLPLYMLTSGFYQPAAWAMVFAISTVLFVLFSGRGASADRQSWIRSRVTTVLMTQLALISPLFLLGVDYGRWLFLWFASSAMICISGRRPLRWLESMVSRRFESMRMMRLSGLIPAHGWYLLVFGVPVCWNLHNFLTANPLGRHLNLLWPSF